MTNRVLIQSSGGIARMLVSVPGKDVNGVLTPDDVIFDDNFSGMDVLLNGSIPAGSVSTTISYGITLSTPPLCLCYFNQNYTVSDYLISPNAFIGSGYDDYMAVTCTLSYAVFQTKFGAVYPPIWYSLIRRRG